ncbi:cysteinyl-tRNA synthetase [Parcubacteria bacterium DG_74_1]|nr:MAG: cysteinyl-tRNA synthetase [Parcubacteria bacterium DG_74_1]
MLRFYNTLSRKREIFKPIKKGQVKIYSCGPTVYDFAHIGNFRAYVFADILRRYLEYKRYQVRHVMNITDIDDKTIKNSKMAKMSLKDFTEKYTKEFFKDLEALNIKKATFYPRATENIKEMIKFTEVLEKKEYAYERLHSVYFDISKFKDYGKLSRIDLKKNKPGTRVDLDEYQKDAPGDFTLFKRSTLDELKRGIFYQTKWGKVRPGWHLECSVMSMKYLGKTFDIHSGGVDLIFPHHENEIAQSEAYTGKKWVNFWLHNEHLVVEGKKMSKSLGNFYTLRALFKMGYSWRAIRYFLVSSHYKQKLNLTFKGLKSAGKAVERIKIFLDEIIRKTKNKTQSQNLKLVKNLLLKTEEDFEKAMDDDLNTAQALAAIFNLIKKLNKIEQFDVKTADQILNLINKFDSVLGLRLLELKKPRIPQEIKELTKLREKYRREKNWLKADKIRKKIKESGYHVEDTKDGPEIKISY